jgi:predicted nucleic acid-binding protein
MIFVDANIFMYAAGRDHPYKVPCLHALELIEKGNLPAVADVEVLQELLYRYWHIGELEKGLRLYDDFEALVPEIFDVTLRDVDRARSLMKKKRALSPRDALHVAVMLNHRVQEILSVDTDFDAVTGIRRINPADLE